MNFGGFSITDFPPSVGSMPGPPDGFVYVLCWIADSSEKPFYVGQTKRLAHRMEDYCAASFAACADFRVGEAIKYLTASKKHRVVVDRPSPDPLKDETAIIRDLSLSGVWLLNFLPGYDYSTADKEQERSAVRKFCDMITCISA